MSFCSVCGCHVEAVPQPAVQGWAHACRHSYHRHLIPFVISKRQRDERFAQLDPRD